MVNSRTKKITFIIVLVLSVSLISSALTYLFLSRKAMRGNFLGFNKPQKGDSFSKEDTINVKLFFLNPASDRLDFEIRRITNEGSVLKNIEAVLTELIRGPRTKLINTIPKGTKLLNIFLDDRNVLYINFNNLIRDNHPCGFAAEYQTICSLFKTIYTNFGYVQKIIIMLDGEIPETLCGHIALSASYDSLLNLDRLEKCAGDHVDHRGETRPEPAGDQLTPSDDEDVEIPLYKPEEEDESTIEEIRIN